MAPNRRKTQLELCVSRLLAKRRSRPLCRGTKGKLRVISTRQECASLTGLPLTLVIPIPPVRLFQDQLSGSESTTAYFPGGILVFGLHSQLIFDCTSVAVTSQGPKILPSSSTYSAALINTTGRNQDK